MTIEKLEEEIQKVYLLNDKGIIRIILATILANKLNLSSDPVWLLILAGSSSGKTALLQTLDKIGDWIIPVDTLTTNTFASGLQRSEEVSLLWKANQGILVFKDFTTITSMNEEGLREIMGQLRAIYDGSFDKKTGNGQDIAWVGRIGMIGGGTIAVQRKMRQYSEQGERFINYILKPADSKEMTRRAMQNQKDLREKRERLTELVANFVNEKVDNQTSKEFVIPKEIEQEMIDVADFCTLARSPVIMNQKTGVVEFVPDREMPMRMAMMLTNIAVALMVISEEDTLSNLNALIVYKTAMDSIPVDRRMALRLLAQYRGSTTKNLAVKLNYPTSAVLTWLMQLNALKIITRSGVSGTSDVWRIKDAYKDIVLKYENLTKIDEDLQPSQEELMSSGLTEDNEVTNQGIQGYDYYDEEILKGIDFNPEHELDEAINTSNLLDEIVNMPPKKVD